MSLNFVSLKKNFHFTEQKKIKKWLSSVIISKEKYISDINIIFCTDKYLLDLNINYLNHNTLTDIITFDYSFDEDVSGDLYISIDRIKYNAEKFGVSFNSELNRVMVHGILHLCGYHDKSKSESKLMKYQENKQLKKLLMIT